MKSMCVIYQVESDGSHSEQYRIIAPNGKIALQKFKNERLADPDNYEIRKIKTNLWELTDTLGNYFYAEKEN